MRFYARVVGLRARSRDAALYTPYGGQVRVIVDGDGPQVRIRIRDNGCGIPRDELHHIFELFNRGGKRSDGQSAGIGLAVVTVILPRDLSS